MEWKEGNLSTARKLYQKALAIDSTSESAARCLQVQNNPFTPLFFLLTYVDFVIHSIVCNSYFF